LRVDAFNELIKRLCQLSKAIASGRYDTVNVEMLFELTKEHLYPPVLVELAESFGMMLVKVEARDLHAQRLIAELERAKAELESNARELERKVAERTADLRLANDELQKLALLDGLTRLPNRRRFDEYLGVEWKRSCRERSPLSLLLIDVDHFKLFNDGYGHLAGDECLMAVARTIGGSVRRPADLAARYGGEEFAVVLPNTDAAGALYCAETMRNAVERLRIPHSRSTTGEFVTISVGIAWVTPSDGSSPAELISLTDEALYQAKEQGRNRVVMNSRIGFGEEAET
jgi:diguanylate cyclase (GGDEF)-like protein